MISTSTTKSFGVRRVLCHVALAWAFGVACNTAAFMLAGKFVDDEQLALLAGRFAGLIPFILMLINLFGSARAVPWRALWQRPAIVPFARYPPWQLLLLTVFACLLFRYGADALSVLYSYYRSIWFDVDFLTRSPVVDARPLVLVNALIGAPLTEELIHRAVVLNVLLLLMRPHYAVLLGAALFSVGHLNGWLFPFLLGIFFGYAYLLTGRLWIVIAAHAAVNAAARLPVVYWPWPIASVAETGAGGIVIAATCVVALVSYWVWCTSWFRRVPVESALHIEGGRRP